MQKLVLIDPDSGDIVEIIENVTDLKIDDQGEAGLQITWKSGRITDFKADLVVLDEKDFPNLKQEGPKRQPAPAGLRAADTKANFPNITLEFLQKEIEQLRAEIKAMKAAAAPAPAANSQTR